MTVPSAIALVLAALAPLPQGSAPVPGSRPEARPAPSVDAARAPASEAAQEPTPFRAAQEGAPHRDDAPAPTATANGALPPEAAPDASKAIVEAWPGTLADGLAEVRRLVEAKDAAGARALCERLLAPTNALRWKERALAAGGFERTLARAAQPVFDVLGVEALSAPARGEVQYASGLAAASTGDAAAADAAFGAALALAGPGDLRLSTGYQLATVALLQAEMARLAIPEVQQKLAAANGTPPAQPAAPATNAQPGDPAAPDPIQVARGAYLRARERYVERLRADWRDADARANTELVMKRLKELDELEKQREEQKKQDQKENPDPNQQEDSKDPKDQKKDQESKPKDGDEKKDDQERKPDDPKEPEPREDPKDPKDAEKKEGEPKPQTGEERELSKEEMTRLYDLLKQREQQWKKLQQQLHQARRAKVKKDW
ncbi:MAG: hypothetical protein IPJ77_02115 [Planctomycetes bacterium]|nr:hypothetical protein [Planctomycetota bacterium]